MDVDCWYNEPDWWVDPVLAPNEDWAGAQSQDLMAWATLMSGWAGSKATGYSIWAEGNVGSVSTWAGYASGHYGSWAGGYSTELGGWADETSRGWSGFTLDCVDPAAYPCEYSVTFDPLACDTACTTQFVSKIVPTEEVLLDVPAVYLVQCNIALGDTNYPYVALQPDAQCPIGTTTGSTAVEPIDEIENRDFREPVLELVTGACTMHVTICVVGQGPGDLPIPVPCAYPAGF